MRALSIRDIRGIRTLLAAHLDRHGYFPAVTGTAHEGIVYRCRTGPDVLVIEVSLPGVNGIRIFECMRAGLPAIVCLLISGFGAPPVSHDDNGHRAGASAPAPLDDDEWLQALDRAVKEHRLPEPARRVTPDAHGQYGFDDIMGVSSQMREVFRMMSRMSSQNATVLILGESGTGKELVARAIHKRSARHAAPFVAVNCSAIPLTLFESEIFGFEKGSFTDARESHAGKFEQADKGTLFLDEIGDLPLEAQAKLLRVLQEREVTRIGARKPVKIDVRLLAATNKDLDAAVRRGQFREDLFWRLNVLNLKLPPLRQRLEDLPLLIHTFVRRYCHDMGIETIGISPEARRLLMAHSWPGNIRELENTIQRAILMCEGPELLARDLPVHFSGGGPRDDPGDAQEVEPVTLGDAVDRATRRIERAWIQSALSEHHGNRTAAAGALGINRKTLFNKMREHGFGSDGALEWR